jgi:hypothetical protein
MVSKAQKMSWRRQSLSGCAQEPRRRLQDVQWQGRPPRLLVHAKNLIPGKNEAQQLTRTTIRQLAKARGGIVRPEFNRGSAWRGARLMQAKHTTYNAVCYKAIFRRRCSKIMYFPISAPPHTPKGPRSQAGRLRAALLAEPPPCLIPCSRGLRRASQVQGGGAVCASLRCFYVRGSFDVLCTALYYRPNN